MSYLVSIVERLGGNHYVLDEEQSHIQVNQDVIKANGAGPRLIRICPAHVYSEAADGQILVADAGCLECGTCLALMPAGTLTWHYPRGGFGVSFRQG